MTLRPTAKGVFHHATFFLNGEYLMSHEYGFPLAIPTPRNCCWGPRNIYYGYMYFL